MQVLNPRYTKEQFAHRGDEIYTQHVLPLLKKDNEGKFVVIDIETGACQAAWCGAVWAAHRIPCSVPARWLLHGAPPMITGVVTAAKEKFSSERGPHRRSIMHTAVHKKTLWHGSASPPVRCCSACG